MMCPGGCTINTDQPFTISHFQNSSVATTVVSQVKLRFQRTFAKFELLQLQRRPL